MLYPFGFLGGAGIDPQAQAHYDRVIADNGVIPSGLNGVNNFFKTVKAIYGTSDITTAISVGLDAQVLGYNLGAGAGTTAGQAAQKLYSCSGASGDVEQTVASSQPLLLVHEGANYWFGSGVDGNYVSTPDAPANRITGDIDIIIRGSLDNNPTSNNLYFSKWENSGNVFFFGTDNTGKLRAGFSIGGVVNFASSSVNYTTGLNWYRLTRVASTGAVTFYQSTQQTNDINSVIWGSPLGTIQSTTSGNLDNLNTIVSVFRNDSGSVVGKIYRATLSNSIGGAPVVDFNPNQYNAATSQTQWTSTTTGEEWNINTGTATTGYKGVLVDRTITMGDGVDDSLESLSPLVSQPNTIYFSNRINSSGGGWIIDGLSVNRQIINKTGANINLFAGTFANATISVSLRNLLTCVFNGASSQIQLNNGTATTGLNTGTLGLQNLTIHGTAGAFAEGTILTTIVSNSLDNSTARTAMYDYIKSINNNAF
jgi:hypothetical protein